LGKRALEQWPSSAFIAAIPGSVSL
jgi:hypothetical protein